MSNIPWWGYVVLAGLAVGGYLTRDTWLPWFKRGKPAEQAAPQTESTTPTEKVIVTDKAQREGVPVPTGTITPAFAPIVQP